MTVLSDRDIKAELAGGGLVLDPMPDAADYQPASVDVRICLKDGAKRPDPRGAHEVVIDADGIRGAKYFHDACPYGLLLAPGQCALVTTRQRVEVGAHLAVEVYGRSSIARTFLTVHQTAGWVDAGFKGQITLELRNEGPSAIRIHDGARLAQIKVVRLSSPAEKPYGSADLGSHYQGQSGATAPAQAGEVVK